jgi:hypothetical protein
MTFEDSKNYRIKQKLGLVLIGLFFFLGVLLFDYTQNWTMPVIICIIAISLSIFNYRAAKMEVLSILGIDVSTYERLVIKKRQRRVRR